MIPTRVTVFAALFLGASLAHAAPDEAMTFRTAGSGGNCIGCMWIAASGRIERDTAERFRHYLATDPHAPAWGGTIHIDSAGGDVFGAIRLGEAIRERGAIVMVSHTSDQQGEHGITRIDWDDRQNSACEGACLLAFAGGKGRYALPHVPDNLRGFQALGELRIAPLPVGWEAETDPLTDRRALAVVIDHLDAMGSSPRLLSLLEEASREGSRALTKEEIDDLSFDTLHAYDVDLVTAEPGIAVVEIDYAREDRAYRAELFCQDSHLMLRMSIRYGYSLPEERYRESGFHQRLQLNGIDMTTVESMMEGDDGGLRVEHLYRVEGVAAAEMTDVRDFDFTTNGLGGHWTDVENDLMAFRLPEDFGGMSVLPQACIAGEPGDQPATLLASSAEPVPVPEDDGPGRWRITRKTNPLDDSPTLVMSLDATTGRNSRGDEVTFIARCESDTTEAYIAWDEYLGDDTYRSRGDAKFVTLRLGDAPATTEMWGNSTDDQASFAPGWAGDLLKRMVREDRLVAQVTPHGESPITAIFDLTGMDAGLRELSRTCNWSY